MRENQFLQKKEFFVLDALSCLRYDNSQNECNKCIDMCDYNALGIFKKRITLYNDLCTNCAECIGSCPTDALSLESFDINGFVLDFIQKEVNVIVDGIDVPTFGMFDAHHIVSLVLRKKENIEFVTTTQTNEKIKFYIQEKVTIANRFLQEIEFSFNAKINYIEKDIDSKKRGLLKNIFTITKELKKDDGVSKNLKKTQKYTPPKLLMLKNSIKLISEELKKEEIPTIKGLIANKEIDFLSCTNCGECVHFCPTDALFRPTQNDTIMFTSGKCISCGICKMVCASDAISSPSTINLIRFAYDQAEVLVQYEYHICKECKTAFAYKGIKDICDRCDSYIDEFEDMFTMAKDI